MKQTNDLMRALAPTLLSRSAQRYPKRPGQRSRRLVKQLHQREGLCSSRSFHQAGGGRQGSCGDHQIQRPPGARDQRSERRAIASEILPGESDPGWGPQNICPGRIHPSLGLGESCRARQSSDDGILREDDDVRGAGLFGWRANQSGLADDSFSRAQLPTSCSSPQTCHSEPVQQISSSSVDGSKLVVPQGHRHVRDEAEAVRDGQSPGSTRHRFRRSSSKSQSKAQKAERRKRRTKRRRSSTSLGSSFDGVPEPRSSGFSNGEFAKPEYKDPDFDNLGKFFNCKFDNPTKPLDSFALIAEALDLLERTPCAFNSFKRKSLVPAWNLRTVTSTADRCPFMACSPSFVALDRMQIIESQASAPTAPAFC